MKSHTITWRRLDTEGRDLCAMDVRRAGVALEGVAVFAWKRRVCALHYAVDVDRAGRTRRARIGGFVGDRRVAVTIEADRARRWRINGRVCPGVAGCDDVDLSFTPATNTLPIRRLALSVGESSPVRAAWVRFPDFKLHPLEQIYRRTSRSTYEYRAGRFRAALDVNEVGLVTRYGRLWREVHAK